MKNDNVALIQRILGGDEAAFESLIRKYRKQIHAHAWRKTDDFHIAEDITQETFLQVYRKLNTLEDPTQFTRWLYKIVNHLCIAWFRKNPLQTESLEETDISEIETGAYSRYVAAEHEKTSNETQRDFVNKLLAKLKERDREVITLHYFEEMTSSEIGTYLGVSENTIKSRIRRARQRLKSYDFMIQEELDIIIEGEHPPQQQLKGEINMADEVRNESEVDVKLAEMQRQIDDLQEQIKVLTSKSEASMDSKKNDAFAELFQEQIKVLTSKSEASNNHLAGLLRLPDASNNIIRWGYGGAYRAASGKSLGRRSIWTYDIDEFLSKAPDAEIANLASFFTNPTIVSILRQLVKGNRSVKDLADGCGISESEMEKSVEALIKGNLAIRTDDDLIEPKNDAVFYYLNFVSMTKVYLSPEEYHSGN